MKPHKITETDMMDLHGSEEDKVLSLCDNAPVLLVGNKKDLLTEREVSEETIQYAIENSVLKNRYFETTALSRADAEKLFQTLIEVIIKLEWNPLPI
ncbi:hypothetical protein TNCV_2048071 [Trichonephila clavipes]|nr:hypothetical protein TNCV_2048071 [Trichonephila clavipes]